MPSLARRAVLVMALAGGTPLVHGFVTAPGLARWGSAAPKPSWGAVRGQVPILRTRGTTTHAAVAAPVRTGGSGDDGEGGVNEGSDARDDAVQRPWPAKELRVKDYSLSRGEVAVRFINAPGRYPSDGTNDIIAAAQPGENLLKVGDSVGGKRALRVPLVLGNAWCSPPTLADTATRTPCAAAPPTVKLPRGCMTGLCGSCTCDIEEPSVGADYGFRAIARACSTTVAVPEGCEEMVVDVYRMINNKGKPKEDPMARFNKMDDPNEGFKARWDLPQGASTDCGVCGTSGVDPKGRMPDDCTLSPGCPFRKPKRI